MKTTIAALCLTAIFFCAAGLTGLSPKSAITHGTSKSPPTCSGFSGTFSSFTIPLGTSTHPQSIAVTDFNQDGYDDLAVAEGFTLMANGKVALLTNDQSGSFAIMPIPAITTVGVHPVFVVALDLTGDGFPDIAVVNQDSENLVVILNN